MKVYRYNEEKIFVGEEEALLNPLETKIQGKNVYLLPANSTFEKPKIVKGKVPVFVKNKWEYYEDNRNKYYYDNSVKQIKDIKDKHIPLTEEELNKINQGMTCEVKDGKYEIYFTEEQKQNIVRDIRDSYLKLYIDYYQEKPLLWEELDKKKKDKIIAYRKYLLDYTKLENWFEQNPVTFEEYK